MTLHIPLALSYVLIVVVGSVYWPNAKGLHVETYSALLRIR